MRITCTVDQLRKIRDYAFETAAKCVENYKRCDSSMIESIASEIRAMKLKPVEVEFQNVIDNKNSKNKP